MTKLVTAKADLERAMRSAGRLERGPRVSRSDRYAAVTVMQPYAWLIAHAPRWPAQVLGKTIENRSRPTSYRGPVLIHVSRRWEQVGRRLAQLRELGLVGGACPSPRVDEMRAQLGKVIARAQLVGCRRVADRDPHPWGIAGSWGWQLDRIELVEPFGLRGHPGLWFAPRGLNLRVLPHRCGHLLGGLPGPGAPELGLRFDATSGWASVEVASLVEAARVVGRSGLRRLDDVVLLDGELVVVGRLFARAAAEVGDHAGAALMSQETDRLVRPLPWTPSSVVCPPPLDYGPRGGCCA